MKPANPFAQPLQIWEIEFSLSEKMVPLLEEAFAADVLSMASFETKEHSDQWRTTFHVEHEIAAAEIIGRLALLEELTGERIDFPHIRKVIAKDWVKESQQAFPPFSVGPFYIHGSHVEAPAPAGSTPLLVDANAAFGTGEHATTQACLLAIEAICRQGLPSKALDMGCGSAILAIALGKRWHVPALGVEIDAVSVHVAKENVRLNRVQREVRVVLGDGYAAREVRQYGPFDLIVANILARPLMAMAPQLARHLAPGGNVVLSGLLNWQEPMVLAAHRQQGLGLVRRWRIGDWSALWLKRPKLS
jgi:ribosomal protein L11 methyltransferase